MRGEPDAALERRQREVTAKLGREPRVRHRASGPDALVKAAKDRQVGALQPRLERTVDRQPGMAAIRRTHRRFAEEGSNQRRGVGGNEGIEMMPVGFERCNDARKCPSRWAPPDPLATQRINCDAEVGDESGEVDGRPGEAAFERIEERGNVGPPRTEPGGLLVDAAADAVEARPRAHAAQGEVEPPDIAEPRHPCVVRADQRMLEHAKKRNCAEPPRRRLDETEEQCPRRRHLERRPCRIVDDDAPAAAVCGDAPCKPPVGRDQRRRLARGFERTPQRERDHLRLLGRVGRLDLADAGKIRWRNRHCPPVAGECGGSHRLGDPLRATGGAIGAAGVRPQHDLTARDAEGVEQALHRVLRVFFAFAAAATTAVAVMPAADASPCSVAHDGIEAGEDDQTMRQSCHHAKQPRHRRRRGREPRGDDRPRRRCRLPTAGQPIETRPRIGCRIDLAVRGEQRRPKLCDNREKGERLFPVVRHVERSKAVERGGIDLFERHRIERGRELIGQPQGLDRRDGTVAPGRAHAATAPDQLCKQQTPLDRVDRRQGVWQPVEAAECAIDIADRGHTRQQQAPA